MEEEKRGRDTLEKERGDYGMYPCGGERLWGNHKGSSNASSKFTHMEN